MLSLRSTFQVVQLISTEILPFANFIPKEFVGQIMTMLNKGSIHSQAPSFTGNICKSQSSTGLNPLQCSVPHDLLVLLKCFKSNRESVFLNRSRDRRADAGGVFKGLLRDAAAVLLQQQGVYPPGGVHLSDGALRASQEIPGRSQTLRGRREAKWTLSFTEVQPDRKRDLKQKDNFLN